MRFPSYFPLFAQTLLQRLRRLIPAVPKCAGTAVAWAAATSAFAAPPNFPNRPVEVVVPYSAGGGYDNFGRALAAELQRAWNQPVVVQNRPGASEIIGAEYVKKAKPDGYTLFLGSEVALVTNPMIFRTLRYDPTTDFTPVTCMLEGQLVYATRNGLGPTNLKEFIALARNSKDTVTYGSAGVGAVAHVAMGWMALQTGIKLSHVPYKGAAPILQDMLGKIVDSTVVPMGAIFPYLETHKLQAIGVTGPSRMAALPDVPTVTEQGYPSFDQTFFLGIVAPAGTPLDIRRKIATDIHAVISRPEFQAKYMTQYGYLPVAGTPEAFETFLARDRDNRRKRIEPLGIKLD
ncbi:Bug family tripartite tricarboxylate transporter substrate binding protein [Cupriavidus sp. 30B13]|uniref:Bug family tripartite tricarboxylate transporter substrate binding protein n=1 Tax=Cupriavidus sp. 30B13 TaxID=3384241 RepID=UPI003B90704B